MSVRISEVVTVGAAAAILLDLLATGDLERVTRAVTSQLDEWEEGSPGQRS